MSAAPPRISVIMRTKNCADVVGQALAGLYAQRERDFELLVNDSGSRDRTLEIVRGFPCRLIEIAPTDYYPGLVLNRGARETTGELLVFQNSDVVPLTPDALTELVRPFEDPRVDATFARQVPRPEAHGWVRRDYETAFPVGGAAPPWMFYSLPFAAMRRSTWAERPFYDKAWGSEDSEWGAWARKSGKTVRYVPTALVMHSHNYTLKQLYGRRYIEGEADAFILGDRDSLPRAALRVARSIVTDLAYLARRPSAVDLALIAPRRLVYHLAYLKGHKLGERRIATGDRDASQGQRAVLASQEPSKQVPR